MSHRLQVVLVGLVCFVLGCLLAPRLPFARAQDAGKAPTLLYGLDLKVRKGGELEAGKGQKIGVDVFRDESNNLVYISETGSIAVAPAK